MRYHCEQHCRILGLFVRLVEEAPILWLTLSAVLTYRTVSMALQTLNANTASLTLAEEYVQEHLTGAHVLTKHKESLSCFDRTKAVSPNKRAGGHSRLPHDVDLPHYDSSTMKYVFTSGKANIHRIRPRSTC
jgi:hypothetical protein